MSTSVTYTGTDGAGMTAVIDDLGSWAFGLDMPDGWGEWKDTRRYKVIGPSTAYDATLALSQAGIAFNGNHPYIAGISSGGMRMVEKVSGPGFIMEINFSRPPMGVWGTPNVLARPVVVSFGFTFMRIPTEKDSQGYVVVNSAGDIFDPAQTIEIAILKVRCAKWLSAYSISNAQSLVGHINESSVTLSNSIGAADARTLKCLNYAPANDIITSAGYVFTIFELEQRLDTYDRKLIDRGFRAWYNDKVGTNKRGKLLGKTDLQPVPQQCLLAGDGTPLLPDHLLAQDNVKGFDHFQAPATSLLPSYLTAVRGADGAGGYLLPYRVEPEADFSAFAALGL